MDCILETRNLTKKIKSENIIKGISLKIPKGETYGLLRSKWSRQKYNYETTLWIVKT